MTAEARRKELILTLKERIDPVTGGELAQILGVSRQVVVQDVALLRAQGLGILATPQGYLLADSLRANYRQTVACQHDFNKLKRELELIIHHGGKVIDVTVEHPLYGELQGLLMLKSSMDVEQFMAKLEATTAKPLSALTDGVHLHTIEAESQEILADIVAALKAEGFLVAE